MPPGRSFWPGWLRWGSPAASGADFTATVSYDDNKRHAYPDPTVKLVYYEATFTLKDSKGAPPPKGTDIWVKVGSDTGDDTATAYVHLTTTDATGVVHAKVGVNSNEAQPVATAAEITCNPESKDPQGQVTFNAATGTLTYHGGTIAQVMYSDMTSTSVNTPTETIIGSALTVTGLHLVSSDGMGNAAFTGGTFSITNGAATYLQAADDGVFLSRDPVTGDTILLGLPSDYSLNTSLNSRYISELSAALAGGLGAIFELDLDEDLSDATAGFTQDATANVVDCPYGRSYLVNSVPEPSSWALLACGVPIPGGFIRRRTPVPGAWNQSLISR